MKHFAWFLTHLCHGWLLLIHVIHDRMHTHKDTHMLYVVPIWSLITLKIFNEKKMSPGDWSDYLFCTKKVQIKIFRFSSKMLIGT